MYERKKRHATSSRVTARRTAEANAHSPPKRRATWRANSSNQSPLDDIAVVAKAVDRYYVVEHRRVRLEAHGNSSTRHMFLTRLRAVIIGELFFFFICFHIYEIRVMICETISICEI